MRRKQIPAHVACAIIAATTLLTGCGNVELTLSPTMQYEIEVGGEISKDVKDYVTVTIDGKELADLDQVTVDTSKVDTNTVGAYTVTVSYKNNKAVIPVTVTDTTAPELTTKDIKVATGTIVKIQDVASLTDNSDANLAFVVNGECVPEITVTDTMDATVLAKDIYNNEITKTVHVESFVPDTEAPVVQATDIKAVVGSTISYMDKVTATDNVDKDLTASITVTGTETVDANTAGTYPVTYTVTDKAGNVGTVTVNVIIEKKAVAKKATTAKASTAKTGTTAGTTTTTSGTTTPSAPASTGGTTSGTTTTTETPAAPAAPAPPAPAAPSNPMDPNNPPAVGPSGPAPFGGGITGDDLNF